MMHCLGSKKTLHMKCIVKTYVGLYMKSKQLPLIEKCMFIFSLYLTTNK